MKIIHHNHPSYRVDNMAVVVLWAFVELSMVIEATLSNSLDPFGALEVVALVIAALPLAA